jgi:hypothetical protein
MSAAHRLLSASCALALLALCGCAPRYTPFDIDRMLASTVSAARYHLNQRRPIEAMQLAGAAARVDPQFQGLPELLAALPADVKDVYQPTALGSNKPARYVVERSFGTAVLRYIPDRLGDLIEVVTAGGHGGVGAFVDVHFTRGAQLVGGAHVIGGFGIQDRRNFPGMRAEGAFGTVLLNRAALEYAGLVAGPGDNLTGGGSLRGAQRPTDPIYQDYLDYWAIGATATVAFGGGHFELHPVQLADFFAGFAGVDFLNDDRSRTRDLQLQIVERDLLQDLARVSQSLESLAEYERRKPQLQAPQR